MFTKIVLFIGFYKKTRVSFKIDMLQKAFRHQHCSFSSPGLLDVTSDLWFHPKICFKTAASEGKEKCCHIETQYHLKSSQQGKADAMKRVARMAWSVQTGRFSVCRPTFFFPLLSLVVRVVNGVYWRGLRCDCVCVCSRCVHAIFRHLPACGCVWS